MLFKSSYYSNLIDTTNESSAAFLTEIQTNVLNLKNVFL